MPELPDVAAVSEGDMVITDRIMRPGTMHIITIIMADIQATEVMAAQVGVTHMEVMPAMAVVGAAKRGMVDRVDTVKGATNTI